MSNMQDRIDEYLDQSFGPYEDSPAVADLRIEVRHDLIERLADLLERGVPDEVAYAQVMASVGDMDATIRELAGVDQTVADAPADSNQSAGHQWLGAGSTAGSSAAGDNQPGTAQSSAGPRPEPDGPADSIPSDTTSPGATYQPNGSTGGPTTDREATDWMSSIADVITAGLKTASDQINDALKTAGVTTSDWSQKIQDTLNDTRVWDISIERARRKGRISFAASDMRNADFRGQQLADSTFAGSSLRGTDFTGAILTGSSFKASDLRGVIFNQANLADAKLTMASLRDAQFERTNLTGAVLSYASMRGVAFIGCAMGRVRAKYSDLRGARFADTVMEAVDFTGSDLRDASFDGLTLTNCCFDMSNPRDASFRGAVLRGCSFHHVSPRAISGLMCADTVVDAATYASLQSTGAVPVGIRVED